MPAETGIARSKAGPRICSFGPEMTLLILVDPEQQFVQPGIDDVPINLMRKYNWSGDAVIYNTYRAYLRSTPKLLCRHLQLAAEERFTLGVKLVRRAYMTTEPRHLINDTKEATDNSYDSMATGLLQGRFDGLEGTNSKSFPHLQLFLATHNKHSALKACELQESRANSGQPVRKIQYGQLLGMADEVSCTLLQRKDNEKGQQ